MPTIATVEMAQQKLSEIILASIINVNLLNLVATPEQKARWLAPLVQGEIRSVFSMTETVTDGAGSDPSLLQTTAQQIADGFVINGRKWMITPPFSCAIASSWPIRGRTEWRKPGFF